MKAPFHLQESVRRQEDALQEFLGHKQEGSLELFRL